LSRVESFEPFETFESFESFEPFESFESFEAAAWHVRRPCRTRPASVRSTPRREPESD
jgi:hypothetical protein